jgi:maltose O-acetyltransferase
MKIVEILISKFFYRPFTLLRLSKSGKRFRLGYGSVVIKPSMFSIGDDFFTGPFCYLGTNEQTPVSIGKKVMFGPKVTIQGGNHDINFNGYMYDNSQVEPVNLEINIESGSWVGANSTIISGGGIGEGAIVGAMSLVNKLIPPYVVAAGNPCVVKKARFKSKADLKKTLLSVGSKYDFHEILEIHEKFGISYEQD